MTESENKIEYKVDEDWVESEIIQKFFDFEDEIRDRINIIENDKGRTAVSYTEECLKPVPDEEVKNTQKIRFEQCKAQMSILEMMRDKLCRLTRTVKSNLYKKCRPYK